METLHYITLHYNFCWESYVLGSLVKIVNVIYMSLLHYITLQLCDGNLMYWVVL